MAIATRFEMIPLDVPLGVGNGQPLDIRGFSTYAFVITGPFDADLVVDGTIDGVSWSNFTSVVNAPGLYGVNGWLARYARVRVTRYVSGAPKVTIVGYRYYQID